MILQDMQMDQPPLYASQGFYGEASSSVGGGLGGGGRMRSRRSGGRWRGFQQQGTLTSSYWPRLAVRRQRGNMISYVRPKQGYIVLCWWWRHTMFVAAQSINGGGGEKKGSWRKC